MLLKSLGCVFSYKYVMNMKLLAIVTPPYIYHGYSNSKKFWEEKFTGEKKFTLGEFTHMNMKNCGHSNVRKHREIKDSDKYITLDIYLKFGSLENIRIMCSDPKGYFVISGKPLIAYLGTKSNE